MSIKKASLARSAGVSLFYTIRRFILSIVQKNRAACMVHTVFYIGLNYLRCDLGQFGTFTLDKGDMPGNFHPFKLLHTVS